MQDWHLGRSLLRRGLRLGWLISRSRLDGGRTFEKLHLHRALGHILDFHGAGM
jgi:hypothetical protein